MRQGWKKFAFALALFVAFSPLAWAVCERRNAGHGDSDDLSSYYGLGWYEAEQGRWGGQISVIADAWPVYVQRLVAEKDGCPLYVLKKSGNREKPENQYDIILPVLLDRIRVGDWRGGGGDAPEVFVLPAEARLGFVAYRNGVGVLLNSRGERLISDTFDQFENGWAGWARMTRKEEATWLFFYDGRLRLAPRGYIRGGAGADEASGYRAFVLEKEGRQFSTLLRLKDMREVIPPFVGNMGVFGFQGKLFNFTAEETGQALPTGISLRKDNSYGNTLRRYRLYDKNWVPLLLPEFHDFELQPTADTVFLVLYNYMDMSCRLYEERSPGELMPTIDLALPFSRGNCPRFGSENRLFAQYADTVLIFARQPPVNSAVLIGRLPGEFFARTYYSQTKVYTGDGLLVIVRVERNGKPMYRVYKETGELLHEQWFEDAVDLGCGFLRVKHEGVWYSLRHDGTLTTKMYFPFSC
ncbi:MAG: hypothetical protein LBQ81_05915 [Zoogloeaceae bacterium]|jgi:hypothetical protein|nr:hypothetical protein [Zoogloeaceae bacterium]